MNVLGRKREPLRRWELPPAYSKFVDALESRFGIKIASEAVCIFTGSLHDFPKLFEGEREVVERLARQHGVKLEKAALG